MNLSLGGSLLEFLMAFIDEFSFSYFSGFESIMKHSCQPRGVSED
jgi:hypothetical protein